MTKVQAFLALIICTVVVGVIGGMPLNNIKLEDGTTFGILNSITSGFGGTLSSIGIIIEAIWEEARGRSTRIYWFFGIHSYFL